MYIPIPVGATTFGRSLRQQHFKSYPLVLSTAVWSSAGQRVPYSLTQLRAQRFTSSTSKDPVTSWASPERVIAETLKHYKHDKWGWVIYRTTYDDDEGWARFKQIITQGSLADIAESDAPEIADSLEWTFVEDCDTLDGASKDHLRSRFKQWAPEALKIEQPRVDDHRFGTFGIPRYTYFVDVDEEALKSVVYDAPQPPEVDLEGVGYVNFVDADWKPMTQIISELVSTDDGEEEVHEPIEGCTEENVGWMKIPARFVRSHFYQAMMGYPDIWYVFYQRPPEVMFW
ncbi:hypothetical protein NA56DRAFT_650547 [Hyaloscypha hepaticicola]|uniref:Uncharacterized protein n=1 Tax=Hyaloscypha hepaticicola TaxID=2082293 RepID=A0A2J6PLN5_9HELO|nr:hypothetical protein NA56DRAFT_650547 [Hyaloscypha hepaticicola]